MTTVEVGLNLPDQVATEAQRAGLLSDQAIGRLIEEEIAEEVAAVRAARKATDKIMGPGSYCQPSTPTP